MQNHKENALLCVNADLLYTLFYCVKKTELHGDYIIAHQLLLFVLLKHHLLTSHELFCGCNRDPERTACSGQLRNPYVHCIPSVYKLIDTPKMV